GLPRPAPRLEQAYRQSYAFDSRNSSFRDVSSTADFASFSVTAHYALARINLTPPQAGHAGRDPPSTIPDIRSLFLGFHYSLAKLPDTPMKPRVADARIGYFRTHVWDLTTADPRVRVPALGYFGTHVWGFPTDDRRIPIVHYITRWRLEKKDPAAALSEPK